MSSHENPDFSRAKNSEEGPIDPRLANLPPAERKIYEETLEFRKRYRGKLTLSTEVLREQDQRWNDFMLALLSADQIPLASYASDPHRFPSHKYSLQYLVSDDPAVFNPTFEYRERDSAVQEPKSARRINLDAPYGLCIMYEHDDAIITPYGHVSQSEDRPIESVSRFEPISTTSFTVDLKRRLLLIDHLQGGDTNSRRATAKGKAARAVFETGEGKQRQNAEVALFEAACELARRSGLRGVGLRKASANLWLRIKNAHEKGNPNPYDRVSRIKKLRGFAAKEYFLIPV